MPQYTLERLRPEYEALWECMQVRLDCAAVIDQTARELLRHKAQYQAVEAATGRFRASARLAGPMSALIPFPITPGVVGEPAG